MSFRPQDVHLAIMDSSRPPVRQQVRVRELTGLERAQRMVKRLALTWALAGVSLIIPVAHFVLVPLLLLLGPVLALMASRKKVMFEESQVGCPKCSAAVPILPGALGWPLRLLCGECKTSFDATPLGSSS